MSEINLESFLYDEASRQPFINWFDGLSNYISYQIITVDTMEKRQNGIILWLNAANRCYKMRNFDAVSCILSAIDNIAIQRLDCWKQLPDINLCMYEKLTSVLSHKGNYAKYRKILSRCAGKAVPCINIMCRDMIIALDSNKLLDDEGAVDGSVADILYGTIKPLICCRDYMLENSVDETDMEMMREIEDHRIIDVYRLSARIKPIPEHMRCTGGKRFIDELTVEDVATWLKRNGFEKYASKFSSEGICGGALILLKKKDLEDLGVKKIGDQIKLYKEIRALVKYYYPGT